MNVIRSVLVGPNWSYKHNTYSIVSKVTNLLGEELGVNDVKLLQYGVLQHN